MKWSELREQTVRRAAAGQPVREWKLAQAERASQAALAIPGALAGFALSLGTMGERRRRPFASSIMLGLFVTFTLWGVSTVTHAAALSGRLPPALAGGATMLVATLVASVSLAALKA
jgi:lipopolysaccharide export LptBFGC system permease protein LptF